MHFIVELFHTLSSTEGLQNLISRGGLVALAIIIFAENGLLVGFFLPGDSLLITAGILIGSRGFAIDFLPLAIVLSIAAVLGESVGYYIGTVTGKQLYKREDSRFFKREHLIRTHNFYEKHGGKTIVLARFIPIVRTFVPVVAGAARMNYRRFTMYNIAGGFIWVFGGLLLGHLLERSIPNIEHYLYLVIGIIIVLSMLPPIIEWLRSRRKTTTSDKLSEL